MKTAQEAKAEILAAAGEQTEAIRSFLESLGYKKITIQQTVALYIDNREDPAQARKGEQLFISASYD